MVGERPAGGAERSAARDGGADQGGGPAERQTRGDEPPLQVSFAAMLLRTLAGALLGPVARCLARRGGRGRRRRGGSGEWPRGGRSARHAGLVLALAALGGGRRGIEGGAPHPLRGPE